MSAVGLSRGRAMLTQKQFKIGETVFLKLSLAQNLPGGAYVVTQRLPERDGESRGRIIGTVPR